MKKLVIAGGVFAVLAIIAFEAWQASLRPPILSNLHVRILAARLLTNGSALLDVVITNGTPIALNVVDDGIGDPTFVLEAGPGQSGRNRFVTTLSNTLKINLAPGASLTNRVLVTNPPSQFRLDCIFRNLGGESHVWKLTYLMPKAFKQHWIDWHTNDWEVPEQHTDWIDLSSLTNTVSEMR